MSDTPRTDNLARGNHVVPTSWAEELERELDEMSRSREFQRELAAYLCERLIVKTEQRDELADALRIISSNSMN